MSDGENEFALHLRVHKIENIREFRFNPERRWRADFLITGHKLLIEIEGGTWIGGRHTTGPGFLKDVEKYNSMTVMGYRLLRFTPEMVSNGLAIELTQRVMSEPNQA